MSKSNGYEKFDYQSCTDLHILRERVRELEELAFPREMDRQLFNLSSKEQRICNLLARRIMCTKEQIYTYLYDTWDGPEQKIIDVFICKIRKKLPPTIKILTIWGRGYQMPKESQDVWQQYLTAGGTFRSGNQPFNGAQTSAFASPQKDEADHLP